MSTADERISAAIDAAGIVPEFCHWYGGKRIVVEVGEIPPYTKVYVEDHWDIEQIVTAFRRALEAAA